MPQTINYLVSVQIPEGEDEYNYTVSVARVTVDRNAKITDARGEGVFTAAAFPAAGWIGTTIMEDAQK